MNRNWGAFFRRVWERVKGLFRTARDIVVKTWKRFSANDGSQAAAAFSFYAFLSLAALAILGGAVLGMVLKGNPDLLTSILDYINENFPGVADPLREALNSSIDLRGVLGVTGILVLLYSGTKVFDSFQVWLNRMWGLDKPKYIRKKIKSFLTIFFFVAIMAGGFAVQYFMPDSKHLTFFILVVVYLFGMMFIYSFSIEARLGWRKVWPGALFVALFIYPLQALLTWYYTEVSSFTTIYGSLAGLILPIIAIYYLGYIIYMGAALNRTLDTEALEDKPAETPPEAQVEAG
jgi:membrane protein